MRSAIADINERLKNPEYAREYGAEMAKLDFALALTKARTHLGLTQEELAEKIKTSQPYIAKLEAGDANPTLGAIGSLLSVLGLRMVVGTALLASEAALSIEETASEDNSPRLQAVKR